MLRRSLLGCAVAALCLAISAQAGKFNKALSIGDAAPGWSKLPGVDGEEHSLGDYKSKLLVIVFTCNGCPVAASYQDRMNKLAADYRKDDVALISINANPGKAEALDKMAALVKDKKLAYDYLKDSSQSTAKEYGARATPTVFLLNEDRRIAYMGAFDDNWEGEDAVERHYLRDAITAALAGKKPDVTESRATGCGIPFNSAR